MAIYKENGGDKMSKLLYLDNAATTKTAPEVVEAMLPYFTEKFGNPSSVYSFAAANKEVINQQRDAIAEMIGAKSNEIYFTGGGSESDNWALKCTAEAYQIQNRATGEKSGKTQLYRGKNISIRGKSKSSQS